MDPVIYESGGGGKRGAILADWETPDRIVARLEPMHEDDVDFDADLGHDDGGETIDLAGIKAIPVSALKVLVRYLVPARGRSRWRHGQIRLAILAHALDLDGIGGQSFEALSKELNCSRSLLSLRSLELIDGLGIDKLRNGKVRKSRDTYRSSAIATHKRLGHKMKVEA
jgi:hypothetical protein